MGRKGRTCHYLLPQWFAKLLANVGVRLLGLTMNLSNPIFYPGSHREDSLGLVSADSVTRPPLVETNSLFVLSPSFLSLLADLRAIMTLWISTKIIHLDQFSAKRRIVKDKDVVISWLLNT